MVALYFYLASLACFASFVQVAASPVVQRDGAVEERGFGPIRFPPFDPRGLVCKLPFIRHICPRGGSNDITRLTSIGLAHGVLDPDGAHRFVAKYASASRWQPSTLASTWSLPNGSTNITALPLACPQPNVDSASMTEDCLSLILYVPTTLNIGANVPTFVWIHGGSFLVGSATGPGLDGSKLAIATNSIVAVIQYRLGALGFMPPSGATNLAVGDVINALKFIKNVVPAFGGSSSKITIAGQSAGGNMVRALLATPSASSLFQSGIIQSDPMDFGFLSPSAQQNMQTEFNGMINCGATDTSCHNALSLNSILSASSQLYQTAFMFEPSAGMSQPMRPVRDGTLITTTLDSTSPFPSVSKKVLVSTVANEAAVAIYGFFDQPLGEQDFTGFVAASLGQSRADTLLASNFYVPQTGVEVVDARPQLEAMGTDQMWKCANWAFARNWITHGGTAYVGFFSVGATYPGNEGVPFCTGNGAVCHQDDIQIVFGTVSNPTSAQAALTSEIQARYKSFMNSGNPNAAGHSTWSAASSSTLNAKNLGGSSAVAIGACEPTFWGDAVPFDYQLFSS